MSLPEDPVILYSFVNTQLRDKYSSLDDFCRSNNIDAEKDGVIKEVRVHRSDSVMEGDILVVFE